MSYCFIRKNTPELCKKLEELGYIRSNGFNDDGLFIWINDERYYSENVHYSKYQWCNGAMSSFGIYCEENEEMFLELASKNIMNVK